MKRAKLLAEGREFQSTKPVITSTKKGRRIKRIWNNKLKEAEGRFRICIDCSFESSMPEHFISRLVNQLQRCYYMNKKSQNTVLYSVCSLTGETNELLMHVEDFPSWKEYAFNSSEKSLTEMHPDKSKLIYLTSDSPYELDHLDDSKTYVIGGLIGRNMGKTKLATINKAEKLGIATARLPIHKYLNVKPTKILAIRRVYEILLKYRESNNDWKTTMQNVFQIRKDNKDNVEENEGTINVKDNEDTINIEENENTINAEENEDTIREKSSLDKIEFSSSN